MTKRCVKSQISDELIPANDIFKSAGRLGNPERSWRLAIDQKAKARRRHPQAPSPSKSLRGAFAFLRSAVFESDCVTEDEQTDDDLRNPAHWRARAEEIREKANAMGSPELRERMLVIAGEYERLAEVVGRSSDKDRTGSSTA
jgi:hypothetical protein